MIQPTGSMISDEDLLVGFYITSHRSLQLGKKSLPARLGLVDFPLGLKWILSFTCPTAGKSF